MLVLSNYADPRYALELLESGSERRGYLLKERVHDRAQLRAAILTIAKGGSMMDPKIVDGLVSRGCGAELAAGRAHAARARGAREIAQGKSNAAIAESLVLTKRAVEKHINSIFLKLDLGDRDDVSKRVKAALLFLADRETAARQQSARTGPS